MDLNKDEKMSLKAAKLMWPDVSEEDLKEEIFHARFVFRMKHELFNYMKSLNQRCRDFVALSLVTEIVRVLPPPERLVFFERVLSGMEGDEKTAKEAMDLLQRLNEHREESDVTRKKN